MPVPAKKLPRTVMYRGAAYTLVKQPPRVVTYKGARYVLADDAEGMGTASRSITKDQLKKVKIAVPGVLFANKFFPGIQAMMDPLVRLTTILGEQWNKGMKQSAGGLKKITDAGYDGALYAALQDPDYVVDIMDRFVTALAKLDATATVIGKTVDAAKKEILDTPEFKELLGDNEAVSNYNLVYNSALSGLDSLHPNMSFVIRTKNVAQDVGESAKKKIDSTDFGTEDEEERPRKRP